MSEKLGSRPQYFDPAAFRTDVQKIIDFYKAKGFLDVMVDTTIRYNIQQSTVHLDLTIKENSRYCIDSVIYVGLERIDSSRRAAIVKSSLLFQDMPYDRSVVEDDINRVLKNLKNNGYPNTAALRDPHSLFLVSRKTHHGYLKLAFDPGVHCTFGSITISNEGYLEIDSSIVLRQLEMKPGENFSVEKRDVSSQNLNKLGIFESVKFDAPFSSQLSDTTRTAVVPVKIALIARKPHELAPEIFVNDGNEALNLGVGIGYSDRNFFGSARNFTARARLGFQSLNELKLKDVLGKNGIHDTSLIANGDLTVQMTQPYFLSNKMSNVVALSLIADKERPYLETIIRFRAGVLNQFATFSFGSFDWILERSQVTTYDSANAYTLLQARKDTMVNQFNSILSFTLYRDKTNNVFSPSSGFFHSITIEEAGLVPLLIRNIQPSLAFSQYVKVQALGRWYYTVAEDTSSIIAMKLKGGFAKRYGETRSKPSGYDIPFDQRFYAGGSSSVRGWQYRTLGMVQSPDAGGDVQLEGSMEWRWNCFKPLGEVWVFNFPAMWMVFFVDGGNIWGTLNNLKTTTMPSEIALASGFGYRYETFFGPFRIDYGIKIYNPKETGNKWMFQRRFWKEVFAPGVVQFGIGHAF